MPEVRQISERDDLRWVVAAFSAALGLVLGALSFYWIEASLRQTEAVAIERNVRHVLELTPAGEQEAARAQFAKLYLTSRYEARVTSTQTLQPVPWSHAFYESKRAVIVRSPGGDIGVELNIEWHAVHAMAGRDALWILLLLPTLLALVSSTVAKRFVEAQVGDALTTAEAAAKSQSDRARQLDTLLHDLRKPLMTLQEVGGGVVEGELSLLITDIEAMLKGAKTGGGVTRGHTGASLEIQDLIDSAMRQASSLSRDKAITFHYRFGHMRRLQVDGASATRVITNLMTNAFEAMPHGGHVWLSTQDIAGERGPMVSLSVNNSGSYISESARERLFKGFTSSGKPSGIGLGLVSVNGAVDAWGGRVSVRSHPEAGTEFVVTFPASSTVLASSRRMLPATSVELWARMTPESPDDFGKPRLLVVDDDAFVLEDWQRTCIDAVVLTASSPEEVLARLDADPKFLSSFAAVVTDFYFGEGSSMDGRQLADAIRSRFSGPIFLSTSSILAASADAGAFDAVIEKTCYTWRALQDLLGRGRSSGAA